MSYLNVLNRVAPPGVAGGRVFANAGSPQTVIAELTAAFADFKERHGGRVDRIEAAIDGFQAYIDEQAVRGVARANVTAAPVDPGYTEIFASWFRYGLNEGELGTANRTGERARAQAALVSSPDSAGGYLAPVEWDRIITQQLRDVSPLRRICAVIPTSSRGFSRVWSDGGWGTGWVGETASRPATATPTLSSITYIPGELYAFPMISQAMLEDAENDIGAWLANEVATEMARQEGIAFLSGDGTNKPYGLLTYVTGGANAAAHPGGAIELVNSGAAAGLTADGLVDFVYKLSAPYRQNATWLMNSTTAGTIRKMKDGQGNYLWQPATVAGQPEMLLGFPVVLDENMPAIAADDMPIAFGNFGRGYAIIDRTGTLLVRDALTMKPYVGFYTRKRVGGGLLDPNALKVLKVAA